MIDEELHGRAGKHYKMRDGRVVGPMLLWDANDLSKGYWVDQVLDGYILMWDTEGKFDGFNNPSDNDEHAHLDLVEVVDGTSKTTDPIAAARAMIEPLTGYTPRPWQQGQNNPDRVSKGGEYISNCNPTHLSHPRTENNTRLIAAAPDLRDMVATLADALEAERAKVAAAYEAAAQWHDEAAAHDQGGIDYSDAVGISISNRYELEQSVKAHTCSAYAIRALTPADAQAALEKMLAEARLEGWRAGRDAAADCAEDYCSDMPDLAGHGHSVGLRDAICALPEPKDTNHV